MSKGSTRRPRLVPDSQVSKNWELAFKKPKPEKRDKKPEQA
jgi:hypothetical protein